jgi:hypothetical protein
MQEFELRVGLDDGVRIFTVRAASLADALGCLSRDQWARSDDAAGIVARTEA